MKRYYFMFIFTCIFCISSAGFAGDRLVKVDFEEGSAWSYSDYFNLHAENLADEWTITSSSPHSGSYCARSNAPGDNGYIEDSVFHYGRNLGWGGEIFIKFWAKYPANFDPRGTSTSPQSHNFIRIGDGSSGNWVNGAEFTKDFSPACGKFWQIYDMSSLLPVPNTVTYQTDNAWHEFAMYIKMPSSVSARDGILRIWQDSRGDYSTGNADYSNTAIDLDAPWTHFLFGLYYKGAPKGGYTFYMDDIEIWNGMPDSIASGDTTPPARPNSVSAVVIQ